MIVNLECTCRIEVRDKFSTNLLEKSNIKSGIVKLAIIKSESSKTKPSSTYYYDENSSTNNTNNENATPHTKSSPTFSRIMSIVDNQGTNPKMIYEFEMNDAKCFEVFFDFHKEGKTTVTIKLPFKTYTIMLSNGPVSEIMNFVRFLVKTPATFPSLYADDAITYSSTVKREPLKTMVFVKSEKNTNANTKQVTIKVVNGVMPKTPSPEVARKKTKQSSTPTTTEIRRRILEIDDDDDDDDDNENVIDLTSASSLPKTPAPPPPPPPQDNSIHLSKQQKEILTSVTSTNTSIFITGGAGTGKSVLLLELEKRLLLKYPGDNNKVHVTSTTGIGACNIGGVTIHQFSGFGINHPKTATEISKVFNTRDNVKRRWINAKAIIIDEVSMLTKDLFTSLELCARVARKNDKPFGGIQVILCGDFCQLPPVNGAFAFESEAWKRCITTTFQLEDSFRQAKDKKFFNLLNRFRRGVPSKEDYATLEGCVGREFDTSSGIRPTFLLTHAKDVDLLNKQELNKILASESEGDEETPTKHYTAKDVGKSNKVFSDCPAPAELTLAIGVQVILVKTIDSMRGLVNGSRGVVVSFEEGTDRPVVKFLIGNNHSVYRTVINHETWSIKLGGVEIGKRTQVPLMLGYAISIHKSQGMTIPFLTADLSKVFEYGQAYVAISRARCLEGICLTKKLVDNRSTKLIHPLVKKFYGFEDENEAGGGGRGDDDDDDGSD